jgi:hypothetical protein
MMAAEGLEPPHVEHDVVVHEEDRASTSRRARRGCRRSRLHGIREEVPPRISMIEQKLQSNVPRDVSTTSTPRPRRV